MTFCVQNCQQAAGRLTAIIGLLQLSLLITSLLKTHFVAYVAFFLRFCKNKKIDKLNLDTFSN